MTQDQETLGRYFTALVDDLNDTASRYEVYLKLVEFKEMWIIVPLVDDTFTYPQWLIEEDNSD